MICWDRGRPARSLLNKESDLNETCNLVLMATYAGGAPAVPANHLAGPRKSLLNSNNVC